MKAQVGLARWLVVVSLVAAGCGEAVPTRACMSVVAPGPLVTQAMMFRVDVYGPAARCNGLSVKAGSGPALTSQLYSKGQPIVLDVPPGPHAIVLTTFADAQATIVLGQGCVVSDLSPGARLCFDVTIASLPDLGSATGAADLAMAPRGDMGGGADMTLPQPMPSKCTGSGFILCDGFEGTAIDSATWTPWVSQPGGSVTIDASRAYRGSSSLHAHLDPNGAHATIYTPLAFPPNDLYLRAFLYVPDGVPTAGPTLVTLVQKSSPYEMEQLTLDPSLGVYDTIGSRYQAGTLAVPTGRWFCVEWQVHFDAAAGYSNLWLNNSASAFSPSGTENTRPSPFYYYTRIGLELSPTTPLDVWIDELAANGTRIGCAN
jgi:hypothetical protein